jgi:hypothetical protein
MIGSREGPAGIDSPEGPVGTGCREGGALTA